MSGEPTFLGRNEISSDIAALLLYLVAGYPSDALELAAQVESRAVVTARETGSVRGVLIAAIANLARGTLRDVAAKGIPDFDQERAAFDGPEDVLFYRTLIGVRLLASRLLGIQAAGRFSRMSPNEVFQDVADLAVSRIADLGDDLLAGVLDRSFRTELGASISAFSGPHQLARLLLAAGDRLQGEAIANIATPPTLDPVDWKKFVRRLARTRPYLWANHVAAIGKGYLTPGVSAVVSFPTGAGKSTLSELKIASALFSGGRVVFLAPTRALVWQTVQALRATFPTHEIAESFVGDGAYSETDDASAPDVVVMTPERCLMFLGSAPVGFANVRLLVFDECHLLNPQKEDGSDRRSIDAMFCLLGIMDSAPEADVLLLSAMISNAVELSEWIREATGRECLAETLAWKPTRQVRGCVVYNRKEIRALRTITATARDLNSKSTRKKTIGPPKVLRDAVEATPFALFGLTHLWASKVSDSEYAFLELLDHKVPLSVDKNWQLTANKNKVAAQLAARMAQCGMKTLVFLQSKAHCAGLAKAIWEELGADTAQSLRLTDVERTWAAAAAADAGSADHVISPLGRAAAVHHALLMPAERRLSESVFSRPDGVWVLVATPTVAQGMNLPAESVIIAGEGRFDEDLGGRSLVTAHELLNAAGRAGRAGKQAAGVVLVVPDSLVTTEATLERVDGAWGDLRANIFSKPDQCLPINDPVQVILDRLETVAVENIPRVRALRYFLTRLPVDDRADNPTEAATRLLGRSLAAFKAKQSKKVATFHKRMEQALAARQRIAQVGEKIMWLDRIVSASGAPAARIRELEVALRRQGLAANATVTDWVSWGFRWLSAKPDRADDLLDFGAVESAVSSSALAEVVEADSFAPVLADLERRLKLWLAGATLADIEADLAPTVKSPCTKARKFINEFVYDIAYFFGIIAQIRRAQIDHGSLTPSGDALEMPVSLATLGACVREGVDSPEKLALRLDKGPYESRVACHAAYEASKEAIGTGSPLEGFAETRRRVRKATSPAKGSAST